MTLLEAERIFNSVIDALQDTSHRHVPLSALRGHDIYDICTALKLRVANEYLLLVGRDDFEKLFADGLKLYDSGPSLVAMRVVPDDQVDIVGAIGVYNPIDPATMTFQDKRFAAEETASSLGAFCKNIGQDDPLYWQKVYTRLGLEYTSASPRGNYPFIANARSSSQEPSNGSSARITSYLATALISALFSAILTGALVGTAALLSEGINWTLHSVNISERIKWGTAIALLSPLFVKMVLSISSTPKSRSQRDALTNWLAAINISFALAAFAFLLRAFDFFRSEYSGLLGGTLFVLCYSEMFTAFRQGRESAD
jgi:hypothetical protein